MTASPLFSVVIPAFRAQETVAEAIESALGQTRSAEIIVVDDASPDAQWEVISRYVPHVRPIRLSVNGGEAAAKNAGVAAATGKYVVTLDADDVWLPQRLEAMEGPCAASGGPVIVTTDAWVEAPDGSRRRYYEGTPWASEQQRTAIIRLNFIFSHAAVLRHQWLSTGGMDESRRDACADWPLWVRLILGGARAELVDAPLARYRLLEGSLSASAMCLARTKEVAMRTALQAEGATRAERRLARTNLVDALASVAWIETFGAVYEGEINRKAALRLATHRRVDLQERARAIASMVAPGAVRRRMASDPRLAVRF